MRENPVPPFPCKSFSGAPEYHFLFPNNFTVESRRAAEVLYLFEWKE
jgi:hypothetical protein